MRLLYQQHADFQKLLLPVRQQPRRPIAFALQPQQAEGFADSVGLLAVQARPQAGPHRFITFHCQFEILCHRQRLKDRRFLKLAPDALAGDGDGIEDC